jgi:hypothetical protein
MIHHPDEENFEALHGRGNARLGLNLQGFQPKNPSVDRALETPERGVKEEGLSGPGGRPPQLQKVLSGQRLDFFRVRNLRGKNIAQHPLPAGDQEFGTAELAVNNLGFFQEINRPPALGAADEKMDFGIGWNLHGKDSVSVSASVSKKNNLY